MLGDHLAEQFDKGRVVWGPIGALRALGRDRDKRKIGSFVDHPRDTVPFEEGQIAAALAAAMEKEDRRPEAGGPLS